ncbi:MAG: hypothetical protein ACI80V_000507 [Rhodothermales bacterium]
MRTHLWHIVALSFWCLLIVGLSACDSARTDPEALVLEAYFQPDKPLPPVLLSRATSLDSSPRRPLSGAEIGIDINGQHMPYSESAEPGRYLPTSSITLVTGDAFRLSVTDGRDVAWAEGVVPPRIHLDSIRVSAPGTPIAAVLLDSLSLAFDSLAFGLPSRLGFIYPVNVTMWWQAPPGPSVETWVETSLQPVETFSSGLVDFFLLPFSVLEETAAPGIQLSWSGVYAVPVDAAEDEMPPHFLRAAAVRGSLDYARFALSRSDPDRREPVGNVVGGIGIVTGIALDSVRVYVE